MTKTIHITLAARDIHEEELRGKAAVVIDVLRATSVIITALANGAEWVKTEASIEAAIKLKTTDILLGGERYALPIEGFDCSNSPFDYTAERVKNKGVVLTTTNGTLALSKCNAAEEVLIGAFINHQALTDYLMEQALPVELICAGTNGEFSLDDFLCAGLICTTLEKSREFTFDDLGRLAIKTWNEHKEDVHRALFEATHYNVLKSKGLMADLEFCLQKDTHKIIVKRNSENQLTVNK